MFNKKSFIVFSINRSRNSWQLHYRLKVRVHLLFKPLSKCLNFNKNKLNIFFSIMTNFIFARTFFLIAPYQISQNYAILINHETFFQEKESLQLYRSKILKINSLILTVKWMAFQVLYSCLFIKCVNVSTNFWVLIKTIKGKYKMNLYKINHKKIQILVNK